MDDLDQVSAGTLWTLREAQATRIQAALQIIAEAESFVTQIDDEICDRLATPVNLRYGDVVKIEGFPQTFRVMSLDVTQGPDGQMTGIVAGLHPVFYRRRWMLRPGVRRTERINIWINQSGIYAWSFLPDNVQNWMKELGKISLVESFEDDPGDPDPGQPGPATDSLGQLPQLPTARPKNALATSSLDS